MESAKPIQTDALCRITYSSAKGKLERQIRNGRNRAAPLVVYAPDAETPLLHVNSVVGQFSPSPQLSAAERIFVDTTLENMIARKRRMVESEWKNPEFQRIVVQSLVRKLGDNPSPLLIAQHLAKCEFKSYRSPGAEVIRVSDGVLKRLRRERLQSPLG